MSTLATHFRVRGQLEPKLGADTDVYVTKKSSVDGVITAISKTIRKHGCVTLHATGAANYKALKIVAALQKACSGSLTTNISARTLDSTDFYLPTVSEENEETKTGHVNGIGIKITRTAESP
jgi:hypothetical protein